jgi:hypothetical protein
MTKKKVVANKTSGKSVESPQNGAEGMSEQQQPTHRDVLINKINRIGLEAESLRRHCPTVKSFVDLMNERDELVQTLRSIEGQQRDGGNPNGTV